MANIKSFPNNQDEYIGAENVMKWLHGRSSGVFAAENNASVKAVQNEMAVTVSDGLGWMANAGKDGVVWWIDSEATNGAKLQLNLDPADGVLNRIDRIIVEWKTTNYVDYPEVKVLKGTFSSKATAPALTNNSTVRQISLAKINVAAGTTEITTSMVTDERLDASVCGLVTESIRIDTSVMQEQFQTLLSLIQRELQDLEAGVAVELKKLQFNNISVKVSEFVSDATDEDYPFRASIPLEGVLESMIPEVFFSLADAKTGIFASVSETYHGGVYIYATDKPEDDIEIPTIICWKGATE